MAPRAGGVHPRSTTTPRGGGGYVLAFPLYHLLHALPLLPSIPPCPPDRPSLMSPRPPAVPTQPAAPYKLSGILQEQVGNWSRGRSWWGGVPGGGWTRHAQPGHTAPLAREGPDGVATDACESAPGRQRQLRARAGHGALDGLQPHLPVAAPPSSAHNPPPVSEPGVFFIALFSGLWVVLW